MLIFIVLAATLIGGLVGGLNHKRTSGCGWTSTWSFDANGHYNVTMRNRSFLVHVPPGYTSNTQYPIVFSFHGYGDNDTWQEHITGFSEPGIQINNQVSFSLDHIEVFCIDSFFRLLSQFIQQGPGVLENFLTIIHRAGLGKVPLTHL